MLLNKYNPFTCVFLINGSVAHPTMRLEIKKILSVVLVFA